MSTAIENLKNRATQIANATAPSENTARRVGGVLEAIIDQLSEVTAEDWLLTVSQLSNAVTISLTGKTIAGESIELSKTLPLANNEQAGIISSALFRKITGHSERLGAAEEAIEEMQTDLGELAGVPSQLSSARIDISTLFTLVERQGETPAPAILWYAANLFTAQPPTIASNTSLTKNYEIVYYPPQNKFFSRSLKDGKFYRGSETHEYCMADGTPFSDRFYATITGEELNIWVYSPVAGKVITIWTASV